jgi:glycerol uptake facilitator-like aquaporin
MAVGIVTTLATFFFVFMILLVKTDSHTPSNIGFIQVSVIAGSLFAYAGVSTHFGSALNPAAVLAVQYAHALQNPGDAASSAFWRCYLVCPFLGGALAGIAHRLHVSVRPLEATPDAKESPVQAQSQSQVSDMEQELLVISKSPRSDE